VNRKRDLQRIDRLVRLGKAARGTAEGGKRKVRVPMTDFAEGEGRGSGRMIDLLVDGDDVYLVCDLAPYVLRLLIDLL
jgi:hypothetical protein